MISADERFVIVFNGEIYNFRELRSELEGKGKCMRGQSDTEVLLASYEVWGKRCIEKFHGMFAFAIWDRQRNALFAARDRMGIKPFYYHYSPERFAFASRPEALLALLPELSREADRQAVHLYLECGYIPPPLSFYREIHKLPAAHCLCLDGLRLSVERYWDFRQIPTEVSWENRTENDLLDELETIVSQSVSARMVSDVPLGAFLSGGIDSSLVAATMTKTASQPVNAFTVGFEEAGYDESDHASAVSRHLSAEYHCERLRIDDLLLLLPKFLEQFDEPFFDSSAFPTMALSRMARRYVTVCLSGDGADEVFGGYHYYRIVRNLSPFLRLPEGTRRVIAALLDVLPGHRSKLVAQSVRQKDALSAFSFVRSIVKDFGSLQSLEYPVRTRSMTDMFREAAVGFPPGLSPAEQSMRLDAFYTLPDEYLQKVDLASMAFSLEVRNPLLDHNVVEWGMRLPLKWKLRGRENKYLLRRLAYRYVPRGFLDRPKQGFEVPISRWLRGALKEWATEMLSNRTLFEALGLDEKVAMGLFRLHCSGRRDVSPLLWAVLMLLGFVGRKVDVGLHARCSVGGNGS